MMVTTRQILGAIERLRAAAQANGQLGDAASLEAMRNQEHAVHQLLKQWCAEHSEPEPPKQLARLKKEPLENQLDLLTPDDYVV